MRERQTGSRDVSKGTREGWRSMLRYYKTGRIGLEGEAAMAPSWGAAMLHPYGTILRGSCMEQRTAGVRGDGYLTAMASEVTTGLVVSSTVLVGTALAGE